jgi:hypothetical protein
MHFVLEVSCETRTLGSHGTRKRIARFLVPVMEGGRRVWLAMEEFDRELFNFVLPIMKAVAKDPSAAPGS